MSSLEGRYGLHADHRVPHVRHPRRYFAVVFFDSYESAMQNSDLPETGTAADRHRVLTERQPVYHDLDIIQTAAGLS
jgi:hypothetical protein